MKLDTNGKVGDVTPCKPGNGRSDFINTRYQCIIVGIFPVPVVAKLHYHGPVMRAVLLMSLIRWDAGKELVLTDSYFYPNIANRIQFTHKLITI